MLVEELYVLMKKKKLTSFENIGKFCSENKFEEILETTMEGFASTIKPLVKRKPSLFNFSASMTLSGGNYPCESPNCRLKNVIDLAKFSSVYSDHTTIYNPFDFIYTYFNPDNKLQLSQEKIRLETYNAFTIALELKSLIECGLVDFSRTLYTTCSNCKKNRDKLNLQTEHELEKIAKKKIFPLIRENVKIEYEKKCFHLSGIEPLIGEDLYIHYKKFPEFLIKDNKKINDIKNIDYENPLIQEFIDEAINSLMFQKFDNIEGLTQSYLTKNLVEKTILENIGSQTDNKILNLFINGLLVIQQIPYNYIIKIRDSYPDEFKSFQNHTSELIKKAKNFNSQIEFNTFVNNELEEELKDLKIIQEEGINKYTKKGFGNGLLLGASIATSIATNYDIPSLLGIASTFYGCNNLLSDAKEIEKNVKMSPVYFYFKLSS